MDWLDDFVGGKAIEVSPEMPKPRQRVCLESGLKLDLNKLRRQGLVRPGTKCGGVIRWTNTYTGEEIAHGVITSNMGGKYEGWLRIQLVNLDQTITLVPKPRHFGGYQWYFVCPAMNRYASVLWMPPGANRFCSRQAWGRRVAYASQFLDPDNRAHRGKAKIKSRCTPKVLNFQQRAWLPDRFVESEMRSKADISAVIAEFRFVPEADLPI